jgi:hypothetical protein
MEVIEFEATAEKGIIKIPQRYLRSMASNIQMRVIIMVGEEKKAKRPKVEFKALSVDTKKIRFNRDEANER